MNKRAPTTHGAIAEAAAILAAGVIRHIGKKAPMRLTTNAGTGGPASPVIADSKTKGASQ